MAATLVTVVFAWKASRDGHKAAVAAQETVTTAGEIAEATRNTVTELRNVAEHARQTVETAQAAIAADERDRTSRQLRDIAAIVETIYVRSRSNNQATIWYVAEQNNLAAALAAYGEPLPVCQALAGERYPANLHHEAAEARKEVQQALQAFRRDRA